jgi:hypothetical protein
VVPFPRTGFAGAVIRYGTRYAPVEVWTSKDVVVLDVGNPPEGPDRCRNRNPEPAIGRSGRRSEECHGRESKGSKNSTNFHDYLLFVQKPGLSPDSTRPQPRRPTPRT